jgi:hypothetical protein
MPDLMSAIAHLNQISGYYDADGHYARVQPAGLGVFGLDGAAPDFTFTPQSANVVFDDYGPFGSANNNLFRRCPGGATPIVAGSNPFAAPSPAGVFLGPPNGAPASPSDCDSTQVVPGP